jgi:putative ABC transport system permease protein
MKNELRIVFRKIRNERALSILKLTGLILAFCITVPLVCSVAYQESFDRFHPDVNRIYNVYIDETYHGTKDIYGECPLAVGQYLKDLFPDVESMVRTKDQSDVLISRDNGNTVKESVLYADPSFINVFSLELVSGGQTSFLEQPDAVYIT